MGENLHFLGGPPIFCGQTPPWQRHAPGDIYVEGGLVPREVFKLREACRGFGANGFGERSITIRRIKVEKEEQFVFNFFSIF